MKHNSIFIRTIIVKIVMDFDFLIDHSLMISKDKLKHRLKISVTPYCQNYEISFCKCEVIIFGFKCGRKRCRPIIVCVKPHTREHNRRIIFSQSCGKFFQVSCCNTLNGKFRGNGEEEAETFLCPSVK